MTTQLGTAKVRRNGAWVPAVGGSSAPWTRNPGWLALPTIAPGTQKFVGLLAITNDAGNYVALLANGRGAIATSALNAGGSGYAVGDTGTVPGIAGGAAAYIANTVDGDGAVLTYTLTSGGLGFAPSTNVATASGGAQPGAGTGFTLDILTIVDGGGYHVDWGDGNAEDVAPGVAAEHQYVYADADAATTLTVGGITYRQVIVAVTPSMNLTDLNLNLAHTIFTGRTVPVGVGWLDGLVNATPLVTLRISNGNDGNNTLVVFGSLETFELRENSILSANRMFAWSSGSYPPLPALKNLLLALPACVDAQFLASYSYALAVLTASLPQCLDATGLAYSTYGLQILEVSLPQCVHAPNFALATGLRNLELSLPQCVDASYLLYEGLNMQRLVLSLPLCTYAGGMVTYGVSIRSIIATGLTDDLDVSDCQMDRAALVALFESLGTTDDSTITIRDNYGAAALTAPDIAVATDKGWTVAQ